MYGEGAFPSVLKIVARFQKIWRNEPPKCWPRLPGNPTIYDRIDQLPSDRKHLVGLFCLGGDVRRGPGSPGECGGVRGSAEGSRESGGARRSPGERGGVRGLVGPGETLVATPLPWTPGLRPHPSHPPSPRWTPGLLPGRALGCVRGAFFKGPHGRIPPRALGCVRGALVFANVRGTNCEA